MSVENKEDGELVKHTLFEDGHAVLVKFSSGWFENMKPGVGMKGYQFIFMPDTRNVAYVKFPINATKYWEFLVSKDGTRCCWKDHATPKKRKRDHKRGKVEN